MSNKAVQTGGMYRNRDEFFDFGKDPGMDTDKGSRQWQDPGSIKLRDNYSFVAHQDAPDAVAFTQSKTPQKGGGFKYGEKRMIYKKVDTPAPVTPAASTPEPEAAALEPAKERTPIEHSPEIKQAKERVGNFKTNMDGTQGTAFSTDDSPETEAKAQGLADKYKLNLIEQAVPGA